MNDLLKLMYLDKAFISSLYEEVSGDSPETKVTITENLNASLKIPIASGGASFTESKTFATSIHGMLKSLKSKLAEFPELEADAGEFWDGSRYVWATGSMTVNVVKSSKNKKTGNGNAKEITGEDAYFALEAKGYSFGLITTDDYFTSGISSLKNKHKTITGPISIPVRCLLRVLSAQSFSEYEWVAIPLVISES